MDNNIHILAQNAAHKPAPAMAVVGAARILAGSERIKTWNPSNAFYGSEKNNRLARS